MLIMFVRDLFRIQEREKMYVHILLNIYVRKINYLTNSISSNGIQSIKSTLPLKTKKTIKSDTLTCHNCFATHTHTRALHIHTVSLTHRHTHRHSPAHTDVLSVLPVRSSPFSLNHSLTNTNMQHTFTYVCD